MTTISDFIDAHGITCIAEPVADNQNMDRDAAADMDHWACELRNADGATMTVTFSMGHGHKGKPPTCLDVLECLQSDASGVGQAFEEWARDLGFDEDSRRAERTYNACRRQTEDLQAFLGSDFEAFMECGP